MYTSFVLCCFVTTALGRAVNSGDKVGNDYAASDEFISTAQEVLDVASVGNISKISEFDIPNILSNKIFNEPHMKNARLLLGNAGRTLYNYTGKLLQLDSNIPNDRDNLGDLSMADVESKVVEVAKKAESFLQKMFSSMFHSMKDSNADRTLQLDNTNFSDAYKSLPLVSNVEQNNGVLNGESVAEEFSGEQQPFSDDSGSGSDDGNYGKEGHERTVIVEKIVILNRDIAGSEERPGNEPLQSSNGDDVSGSGYSSDLDLETIDAAHADDGIGSEEHPGNERLQSSNGDDGSGSDYSSDVDMVTVDTVTAQTQTTAPAELSSVSLKQLQNKDAHGNEKSEGHPDEKNGEAQKGGYFDSLTGSFVQNQADALEVPAMR